MSNERDPFADMEMVHTYTRAQAIADGLLIDLTSATDSDGRRLSPFRYPVAMTAAAFEAAVAHGGEWRGKDLVLPAGQDAAGRIWDVFNALLYAIRAGGAKASRLSLKVSVSGREVELCSKVGPGDRGEHVITLMLPGES